MPNKTYKKRQARKEKRSTRSQTPIQGTPNLVIPGMATLNIISGQPSLTPAARLEYSQSQRGETTSPKPLKRAKSTGGKTKKKKYKKRK